MQMPAAQPGRINEIDGLRAIAMTMVVAQHCGLLPFGWIGVWLFFVISGYVISRNFLRESQTTATPLTRYGQFMQRRFFRIVPIYALYLAITTIGHLATGHALGLRDLPFLAGFAFNWQMIFDLWPVGEHRFGTAHLWTLSVEEQFYIFYPLLYLFLPRRHFVRALCMLIVVAPAARLVFAMALTVSGRPLIDVAFGVYAASFCQFDAFVAGALIAVAEPQLRARPAWLGRLATTTTVGVCAYFGTMMLVNHQLGAHGIGLLRNIFSGIMAGQGREVVSYIAVDLMAATVLVAALLRHPLVRGLADPRLAWIGTISYGAYLYHMLALTLLAPVIGTGSIAQKLLLFTIAYPLTIAIASVSYTRFEAPLMVWARQRTHARSARVAPEPA